MESRISGLRSEGVSPLEDHPASQYAGGLDGDALQHRNPPNSAVEFIEGLAGIGDNEISPPRQVFPPRQQDADSGKLTPTRIYFHRMSCQKLIRL